MNPILFDWRFWLVLIIIIVVIRWLVTSGHSSNIGDHMQINNKTAVYPLPGIEEKEEEKKIETEYCNVDPEVAPIVKSWIPPPRVREERLNEPITARLNEPSLPTIPEDSGEEDNIDRNSSTPKDSPLPPAYNYNQDILINSPNQDIFINSPLANNIEEKKEYGRLESPTDRHNSPTLILHSPSEVSPASSERSWSGDNIRIIRRPKKKGRNISLGEELTCKAFKELLQNKDIIHNYRPSFLTNPRTGYPMEIDCYCHELGCGVEYNGIQHYQYPNPFIGSEEDFERQVERDVTKRKLADANGTPIFTVPCTVDAVIYNERQEKYISVRRTKEARYQLIYNYLKEQMTPFLESKGIVIQETILE
jgi:hypothetical protein